MLGPGEVLDRAVALYVRNFWHLVTIVAMTSMPIAIASVIDSPHSIVTSLTDGHLFGPRDPKTPSTSALEYGLIGLGILASFFGGTACEIAADARYRQRSLPLLYVYGQALRRCIAQFVAFLPPAALYAALIITLFAAASTISRAFGSSSSRSRSVRPHCLFILPRRLHLLPSRSTMRIHCARSGGHFVAFLAGRFLFTR
jgi:hypothetical protein